MNNLKERLAAFALRLLEALWAMAVRNPRMTAVGIVGALALVGARWGFELSQDEQQSLAVFIILLIGLVARDNLRKGIK